MIYLDECRRSSPAERESPPMRRGDTPLMPMDWPSYFIDTLHLTTLQHGIYLLLIGAYWCHGKPLPNDTKELARVCRMTHRAFIPQWHTVKPYFDEKRTTLEHKSVEYQLLRVRVRSEAARYSANYAEKANDFNGLSRGTLPAAGNPAPSTETQLLARSGQPTALPTVVATHSRGGLVGVADGSHLKRDDPYSQDDLFSGLEIGKTSINEAIDLWNAFAQANGLPCCFKRTKERMGWVKQRLEVCGGIDGWCKVLATAGRDPWMMGRTRKSFRLNLTTLCRPDFFLRLFEGGKIPNSIEAAQSWLDDQPDKPTR